MATSSESVTQLLTDWRNGDHSAEAKLIPLMYDELHHRARRFLKNERLGHTLQTSALVNETYMRLVENQQFAFQNRAQFLGIAALAMRRVLVDYARARRRTKRGGGVAVVTLEASAVIAPERAPEWLALDAALRKLEAIDPRKSKLVELRYFGGLEIEEIATLLEISPSTVKREWLRAKVWLARELSD